MDGFEEDIYVSGKSCRMRVLRQKYREAMAMTYEMRDFPDVFCRLNRFERLDVDGELDHDVMMDVDTDHVCRVY